MQKLPVSTKSTAYCTNSGEQCTILVAFMEYIAIS